MSILMNQRSEQFHRIDFLFYVLDPSLLGQPRQIQDPPLQFQDQPPQTWVGPPPQTLGEGYVLDSSVFFISMPHTTCGNI